MKFSVSLGEDLLFPAIKLVFRGDVPYGAMETFGIVMLYKAIYDSPGIFKGKGTLGSDAFSL